MRIPQQKLIFKGPASERADKPEIEKKKFDHDAPRLADQLPEHETVEELISHTFAMAPR